MTLSARVATRTAPATAAVHSADFDYLIGLVRARSGIVIEPGKEYLVRSRLSRVMREQGFATVAELVLALRSRRPVPEDTVLESTVLESRVLESTVLDALTSTETSFFRDIHPFDALRTTIVPELLERRATSCRLNVWCAAASSGQEPYSVCMLLREHFPELATWEVTVSATDLSPSMIERASAGRFSQLEVNRGVPSQYLEKYFEPDGASWQVVPAVREMVQFRVANLIDPIGAVGPFDLVLIRNVLGAFDRDAGQSRPCLGRRRPRGADHQRHRHQPPAQSHHDGISPDHLAVLYGSLVTRLFRGVRDRVSCVTRGASRQAARTCSRRRAPYAATSAAPGRSRSCAAA